MQADRRLLRGPPSGACLPSNFGRGCLGDWFMDRRRRQGDPMTRLAIRMGFAGLLALATATCPNPATAQNSAAPPKRLGFLSGLGCSTDANPSPMRRRLTELGWVSGRTLIVDCVSTVHPDQADALAAELVARRPDVLAAQPADYVRALKQATATIPIVMVTTPNPVESGLVTNLARPEANVTGVVSPAAKSRPSVSDC